MEKIYNKLVRDNIPQIMEKNGEIAVTRILNDDEYRKELYKKLLEEANEVITAENSNDTLEEVADVLEILRAIAELENQNIDKIIEIANDKKKKRGGFEKRIFLEKKFFESKNL